MRTRKTAQRLVAAGLLAPLLLGGCFAYEPMGQVVPGRATPLRLRLSTPGDFRLTNVTMNDVGEIDGELVGMDDSTVVLSATRLVSRSGFEHAGEDATLRVPRASIAAIEIKRISPLRTALLVGGVVALGAVTHAALGTAEVSGASGSGGGTSK